MTALAKWRWLQPGFWLAVGILLVVLPWWSGCRYLLAVGYSTSQAIWLALILATCLEMLWLPLLALVACGGEAGGRRGFAAVSGAAMCAAAAIGFFCCGVFADVLWAQVMCLSVAALAAAIVRLVAASGFSHAAGRALATALLAFLYTNPFWARLALETIDSAAVRNLATQVSVWLAPLACLSLAFEGFNFATDLGRIYRIWLGPVVPYPPHPLAFAGAYLLAAGALQAVAALARGGKK